MANIINSKLICITSGSPLQEAKEMLREKRIRHLPIINHSNEIVGILSKHDLSDNIKFRDLPVDLFASSPVDHMPASSPISEVALKMIEKKISSMLLSDENGKAVGIITTDDLLYHLAIIIKDKEKAEAYRWNRADIMQTAGEFFRKLSDIGI